MPFNSLEFALFLPVVFFIYWYVVRENLKAQNILMLTASYVFYGWWDLRFLLLLVVLSLANYFIGTGISRFREKKRGRILLVAGLVMNIGVLAFFKYFNFFIDSFIDLVSLTGYDLPRTTLKVILPLGISFYTFLSISYIVDIYKREIEAERNIVEVLLALSFFPIILAGPIQMPKTLLPQIKSRREFSYDLAVDGLRQIMWGLFAKVVVADNLANNVDNCFHNFSDYSGSTLLIGAVLYAIQIYADFSGYSNIAIGVGKLFGFRLMQNFAYPYFSRDITEFWKRWHISLTTWLRDYIFLPLSFNLSFRIHSQKVLRIRSDHFIYIAASLVTWFLTGLWHGANYTFVLWGMINGLFLILYHLQAKPRKKFLKRLKINNNNNVLVMAETMMTLFIIVLSWVFFRAQTVADAVSYVNEIFSRSLFRISAEDLRAMTQGRELIYDSLLAMCFLVFEYFQRSKFHPLQFDGQRIKPIFRWGVYNAILLLILFYQGDQQVFIYFQF